jgi:hypothetical protein
MVEILLVIIGLLVNRLNPNSSNSSKPPSSDPFRKRQPREKGKKKAGGQNGRSGVTLERVENPYIIKDIKVDRGQLPDGQYHQVGYQSRQVFDIDFSSIVTDYRPEILEECTCYYPHEKRGGTEAMNAMGFKGILCHDHWKPYFSYDCAHALCNAQEHGSRIISNGPRI